MQFPRLDNKKMVEMMSEAVHYVTLRSTDANLPKEWTDKAKVLKSMREKEQWRRYDKSFTGSSLLANIIQEIQTVETCLENNIEISDLFDDIGRAMAETVLICRAITPSIGDWGCKGNFKAIETAMEDLYGGFGRLALFNYSSSNIEKEVAVIPEGAIIVVKNPSLQVMENARGQKRLAVCCSNPGHVELLSYMKLRDICPDHEWVKDENIQGIWKGNGQEIGGRLKEHGNKCFQGGRWTDALRFYEIALEYLTDAKENDELWQNVILNKTASYLQMGLYNKALECLVHIRTSSRKSVYRKGKALLGLGEYQKAVEYLQEELEQNSKLKEETDLVELAKRADVLHKATQLGDIGNPELLKLITSFLSNYKEVDTTKIAEMVGPISLSKIVGKGRGFIATQDIPPGKLLISSKPMGFLKSGTNSHESDKNEAFRVREGKVIAEIANKIAFSPNLGVEVYSLCEGPSPFPFVTPKCEEETDPKRKEDLMRMVDLQRIEEILGLNAFTPPKLHPDENGLGLWILPSYFNHSCSGANAHWMVYGDVMIIRAFKGIKKGDEVLISRIDPSDPYGKRRERCIVDDFICKCELCLLEESEDPAIVKERQEILEWFNENCRGGFTHDGIEKLEKLLQFRKETPHLNPYLQFISISTWILRSLHGPRILQGLYFLQKILEGTENFAYLQHAAMGILLIILRCKIELREKKSVVKETVRRARAALKTFYGTVEAVKATEFDDTVQLVKEYFGKDFLED